MKASAIRIDVHDIALPERAVPKVAIATATIKFQLTGNLSFLLDKGLTREMQEEKFGKLLRKALQEMDLIS